ncbi:ATP-grasp domain-containing protein [Streptomyces sp. NPDC058279]|uniref:ATP-grasp domain-containing protein n=1 Tax=Streptomyces sp. NPDC058279 TaxID=3346418 RepID=UPI0036EE14A2
MGRQNGGMVGGSVFLVPGRRGGTAGLLCAEAARRGMEVRGDVGGSGSRGQVYWRGGPAAAGRVGAGLGLGLLEPPDDWLVRLPERFIRRRVQLTTLGAARGSAGPAFVKPPREKSFPAAVYPDGSRLPAGPDERTPVLRSEVVEFVVEYRLFLLDGEIAAGSRYAVYGRLDCAPLDTDPRSGAVRRFAADLGGIGLPSGVVVDVGLTAGGRWAVVEANMAWFANCYAASIAGVLDVVLRSAGPLARVAGRDLPFVRDGTTNPFASTTVPPVRVDRGAGSVE